MIPMTAIKIIHYLTDRLDTTSQVIHKFSLIHPHELDHFTHPQQTFSSSKYLYSLTGHIFSKTFKCVLVILMRTQSVLSTANSILSSGIGNTRMVYICLRGKKAVTE